MLQVEKTILLSLFYRASPCFTHHSHRYFASSSLSEVLRKPLEIDSVLQAVLHDADFALKKHRNHTSEPSNIKNLDIIQSELSDLPTSESQPDAIMLHERTGLRKSLAAQFGSQRIGSVYIPTELQDTIQKLISGNLLYCTFISHNTQRT